MKITKKSTVKDSSCLIQQGERLKECRKAKNLTQKQLADIVGLVSQAISLYERGERSFRSNVVELASALDVSPQYLLCKTNYKTQLEEWASEKQLIYDSDDLLIRFMRCQGHQISFNNGSLSTPENIETFSGSNDRVNVNQHQISLCDFQFMLDDIKDYIDWVVSRASTYEERHIYTVACDNARQASFKESASIKTLNELVKNGDISQIEHTNLPSDLL